MEAKYSSETLTYNQNTTRRTTQRVIIYARLKSTSSMSTRVHRHDERVCTWEPGTLNPLAYRRMHQSYNRTRYLPSSIKSSQHHISFSFISLFLLFPFIDLSMCLFPIKIIFPHFQICNSSGRMEARFVSNFS